MAALGPPNGGLASPSQRMKDAARKNRPPPSSSSKEKTGSRHFTGSNQVSAESPFVAGPAELVRSRPTPPPTLPKAKKAIIDNGWAEALEAYVAGRTEEVKNVERVKSFKPNPAAIVYNPVTGKWQDPDLEVQVQREEMERRIQVAAHRRSMISQQTRYNPVTNETRAGVTPIPFEPLDGDPMNQSIFVGGGTKKKISTNMTNSEFNIISHEKNAAGVITPQVRNGEAPSADAVTPVRTVVRDARSFDILTGNAKDPASTARLAGSSASAGPSVKAGGLTVEPLVVSVDKDTDGYDKNRPNKKSIPTRRRSHDLISGLPDPKAPQSPPKPKKVEHDR